MTIPLPGSPLPASHWLTQWDPGDGTPYGTLCDCEIGADHDGAGNLMFPEGQQ